MIETIALTGLDWPDLAPWLVYAALVIVAYVVAVWIDNMMSQPLDDAAGGEAQRDCVTSVDPDHRVQF